MHKITIDDLQGTGLKATEPTPVNRS